MKLVERWWYRTIVLCFYWSVCFPRSKIELGDVTQHNIRQLKKLNQVVFPVSYNDKFYKDVLEAGELAKLGIIPSLLLAIVQNVLTVIFCSILQWHRCRRCLLSDRHDWKLKALVHHDTGLLRRIQKTGNWHEDGWTCPQFCPRRWKLWQYFLVSSYCVHRRGQIWN